MQEETQQNKEYKLENGQYYLIINTKTHQALSIKPQQKRPSVISNVIEQQPNENEILQVWMIEEVLPCKWQIVHFQTTYVMQNYHGVIRLKRGDQKSNEMFFVQPHPNFKNNYRIIERQQTKQSVLSIHPDQKIIKCSQRKLTDLDCIWEFKLVRNNTLLNKSCFIISPYSLKAIDVPGASFESFCPLIQYKLNKRCNQRWYIKKIKQQYEITSMLNGMSFEVYKADIKEGNRIVQSNFLNQIHQRWKIIYVGNDLYQICSAKDDKFMVGIQKNSFKDQANICLSKIPSQCLWKFQGMALQQ